MRARRSLAARRERKISRSFRANRLVRRAKRGAGIAPSRMVPLPSAMHPRAIVALRAARGLRIAACFRYRGNMCFPDVFRDAFFPRARTRA